jgi:hypothetical protein
MKKVIEITEQKTIKETICTHKGKYGTFETYSKYDYNGKLFVKEYERERTITTYSYIFEDTKERATKFDFDNYNLSLKKQTANQKDIQKTKQWLQNSFQGIESIGYIGGRQGGLSNSAIEDKERGLLTLSQLPIYVQRLIKLIGFTPSVYHHTGAYKGKMNTTYFYQTKDIEDLINEFE